MPEMEEMIPAVLSITYMFPFDRSALFVRELSVVVRCSDPPFRKGDVAKSLWPVFGGQLMSFSSIL